MGAWRTEESSAPHTWCSNELEGPEQVDRQVNDQFHRTDGRIRVLISIRDRCITTRRYDIN
jgi:hypothetical protein